MPLNNDATTKPNQTLWLSMAFESYLRASANKTLLLPLAKIMELAHLGEFMIKLAYILDLNPFENLWWKFKNGSWESSLHKRRSINYHSEKLEPL